MGLVDKSKILENVHCPDNVIIDLEVLESVSSTNDYLQEKVNQHTQSNYLKVVVADHQTQGKGRLGRSWVAPSGVNIYFSCQRDIKKKISELPGLSLILSLAVVKTLEEFIKPIQLAIKWPNDILYNHAKLSGSLIEIVSQSPCCVVMGVGINVNMIDDADYPISQAWTSLKKITGKQFDRNQIVSVLINHLICMLSQFERHGFEFFLEQWKSYDILLGKKMTLKSGYEGSVLTTGIAKGLNTQGQLLLELENGRIQAFACGDTSIFK